MRLMAKNGRLAIVWGGPLVTVAADRFRIARPSTDFMSNDDFELHFLSNDQFDLKSMKARRPGIAARNRIRRPRTTSGATTEDASSD